MNNGKKRAWIEEENKIASFDVVNGGKIIMKAENLFCDFISDQQAPDIELFEGSLI